MKVLKRFCLTAKRESDFNSSSKRVSYIIKRLIEEDQFISTYDLSEELAVSRGTVNKDIKRMKELIAPWQVVVVARQTVAFI